MITIEKALSILEKNSLGPRRTIEGELNKSLGYTVAEDLFSTINMPPFRQSAMDGYAVNCDSSNQSQFDVVGEIKAGDSLSVNLKPGQAVKIFTGAKVPDSANAVLQKEHIVQSDNCITHNREVSDQLNIRPLGEQVKKGDLAIAKGTKLTPAAIGYLSGLGFDSVKVYDKPKITLVITGNELQQAGEPLGDGKIYESNSAMLQSALQSLGYGVHSLVFLKDDYQLTLNELELAIQKSDLVISSGGISVGDYDFVGKALNELQVQQKFYKVNQKPGKPLYYGVKDNTHIVSLPGNPAAALTCFYVYLVPLLNALSGNGFKELSKGWANVDKDVHNNSQRALILKALVSDSQINILSGQSSAMLNSFSIANALVLIPVEVDYVQKGQQLQYYKLPTGN